jgi:uncharacterized protein (DUF58 family)
VRTSVLAGLTTRGSSFLAAGVAAAFAGYLLGERSLLGVAIALIALPLLTLFAARRAHYRLTCTRLITPPRVPAGSTAKVTLRLHNVTRMPTGLLLAEDAIPYALGTRPRYVLDKIERNGSRELSYTLRSDLRGKFEVGPLQLRVADSFGLVEISRSFSTRTDFVVTPMVYPLARTMISRAWANEGDGRSRLTASVGEDDVIPRAYRDGDDMRRVHWRSTARYGELMVRREEQRRRNRATVFLDARMSAHLGSGPNSSFEFAVSAAASVGVHLAQEGLIGRLITHDGTSLGAGMAFEDMLLDSLAVVKPARGRDLSDGIRELRSGAAGVIVAVLGRLSQAEARRLATCRAGGCQAIALLLDVRTWADTRQAGQQVHGRDVGAERSASPSGSPANGQAAALGDDAAAVAPGPHGALAAGADTGHGTMLGPPAAPAGESGDTATAAAELKAAGWHTIRVEAGTPLPVCWQRLPRAAEMLVPAATLGGHESAETGRPA